jgi:hypothetical protein
MAIFYSQDGFFKKDGITLERFFSPHPIKTELTIHDDGSFTIRPTDGVDRGMFWKLRFVDREPQ